MTLWLTETDSPGGVFPISSSSLIPCRDGALLYAVYEFYEDGCVLVLNAAQTYGKEREKSRDFVLLRRYLLLQTKHFNIVFKANARKHKQPHGNKYATEHA